MYQDKLGHALEEGDLVSVDPKELRYSHVKERTGWVVKGFVDHGMVLEVWVVLKSNPDEFAYFPIDSVTKK